MQPAIWLLHICTYHIAFASLTHTCTYLHLLPVYPTMSLFIRKINTSLTCHHSSHCQTLHWERFSILSCIQLSFRSQVTIKHIGLFHSFMSIHGYDFPSITKSRCFFSSDFCFCFCFSCSREITAFHRNWKLWLHHCRLRAWVSTLECLNAKEFWVFGNAQDSIHHLLFQNKMYMMLIMNTLAYITSCENVLCTQS